MKGYFITFEGPEKSGKSTQAKLLQRYLSRKGFSCLFVREPGSTALGEKIRRILLDRRNTNLSTEAEMLLYMAARSQLVSEVIEPALRKNTIVICDRFLDSTIVYQGYGLGMERKLIEQIGKFSTRGRTPDITLLLDMGTNDNHVPATYKKDRIELRPQQYHQRVKQGYHRLARQYPGRIKLIRLNKDILKTQQQIRAIIDRCLLQQ